MIIQEWPDFDYYRRNFYESWIVESPQRILPRNDFIVILDNLKGLMNEYKSHIIAPNLHYIEGSQISFVYYMENEIISIIVELEKTPENLRITNIAKDPNYLKSPPYMNDIYKAILSIANNKSLLFVSDKTITDSRINVWKRLMNDGYTISVYDTSKPGQTLIKLTDVDQLNQYLSNDQSNRRYRFVLSENNRKWFGYVNELFLRRRIIELSIPNYDFETLNGL